MGVVIEIRPINIFSQKYWITLLLERHGISLNVKCAFPITFCFCQITGNRKKTGKSKTKMFTYATELEANYFNFPTPSEKRHISIVTMLKFDDNFDLVNWA